jgi:hypothetical protein
MPTYPYSTVLYELAVAMAERARRGARARMEKVGAERESPTPPCVRAV